ncbi:hypothetical protein C1646_731086 [Rhizophagus diaphanus]|nr:hypothetical protein C1646_731086 [Rhizophagus diaphanus] [Rhizophagus sp. MUCL 43196]
MLEQTLDGVHILIYEPSENDAHYVNRKRSIHDARMFYYSSLYYEIFSYIIADAAYPLRIYLIKAFSNYYMLTVQKHHFNKVLSLM